MPQVQPIKKKIKKSLEGDITLYILAQVYGQVLQLVEKLIEGRDVLVRMFSLKKI